MAVELATAYVKLQPSARGFQAAAEREMGPQLRRASEKAGDESARGFGSRFTGGLGRAGRAAAVGLGAAFAGAAVLGGQAISAASDLEETQSKVNTVFAESAEGINRWAQSASTNIGQSSQQALAAAGSFGNMFTQLGIGNETAAQMSVQMVELSTDFASFHNADITEVIAAQEAAFRGEYDSVQRFVPTINAAAVEQRALELGLADTTSELDAQDKAIAVQTLLMEGAGEAAGDFDRTSGSLANQQRILAARFEDAKASIGRALLPAMTAVVGFVSSRVIPAVQRLAETWMPRLRAGFEAVADFVRRAWPQVQNVVRAVFDAVVPVVRDFVDFWLPRIQAAFQGVVEMVQRNWPAVRSVIESVFEALSMAWTNYGKPALDAVLAGVQDVARWFQEHWPQITTTAGEVFQAIGRAWTDYAKPVFEALIAAGQWVVAWVVDHWPEISGAISTVFEAVQTAWTDYGKPAFDAVVSAGQTVVDWVAENWPAIRDTIADVFDRVKETITTAKRVIVDIVTGLVSAAVTAWKGVLSVYSWFVDNVYFPLRRTFENVRDFVGSLIQAAVDKAISVWRGVLSVYSWFVDKVFFPLRNKVGELRDAVVDAFTKAVDGVKAAWDLLKSVVKTPINVVIGFYNDGIRKVWNAVISKIPGVGDLGEVARLNKGGWVPGQGNRDTVPALLTPGEFVITKGAAKALGPGVLHALNAGGTLDPGIFGYRQGGYVKSADEALEWARAQHGKPYQFPMVGPQSYDCSGLTSALINFILGRYPHSRRHSSGTVGSDSALAPGAGDNPLGLLIGARPPFMVNQQGATVGHMAATLAGVGVEATPPRVRVGGNARTATTGMFNQLFHLPGYGGLSDADKVIAANTASLTGMRTAEGGNWFGDLLSRLVNRLPGIIYDFFMKKLPGLIVDAIKDMVTAPFSAIKDLLTPSVRGSVAPGAFDGFADGGTVGRNGPILVGERGPEIRWASRGMYIQSNDDVRRMLGDRNGTAITVNNHRSVAGPSEIARGLALAQVGGR